MSVFSDIGLHTYMCIYIYIYIERERERERLCKGGLVHVRNEQGFPINMLTWENIYTHSLFLYTFSYRYSYI